MLKALAIPAGKRKPYTDVLVASFQKQYRVHAKESDKLSRRASCWLS